MPCPHFFSHTSLPANPLNPKISLDAEEFKVYETLTRLAEIETNNHLKGERDLLLATFNDIKISDNTYKIKMAFLTAVKDALFFYLQTHGPIFNCTKSKAFAISNLPVTNCEHALKIIAAIVNGSDPQNVAKSSRLYQLIRQFYTSPAGENVKDLQTDQMVPKSMLYLALEQILIINKTKLDAQSNPAIQPSTNPKCHP